MIRKILNRRFLLRLLLSYIVIPLIAPVLVGLMMQGASGHISSFDWLGMDYVYGLFGLGAMLVLGTPLLFCYLRLGWISYFAFLAGGGICAAITAYVFLPPDRNPMMVGFFACAGMISGVLFRVMLFGFRQNPFATTSS